MFNFPKKFNSVKEYVNFLLNEVTSKLKLSKNEIYTFIKNEAKDCVRYNKIPYVTKLLLPFFIINYPQFKIFNNCLFHYLDQCKLIKPFKYVEDYSNDVIYHINDHNNVCANCNKFRTIYHHLSNYKYFVQSQEDIIKLFNLNSIRHKFVSDFSLELYILFLSNIILILNECNTVYYDWGKRVLILNTHHIYNIKQKNKIYNLVIWPDGELKFTNLKTKISVIKLCNSHPEIIEKCILTQMATK